MARAPSEKLRQLSVIPLDVRPVSAVVATDPNTAALADAGALVVVRSGIFVRPGALASLVDRRASQVPGASRFIRHTRKIKQFPRRPRPQRRVAFFQRRDLIQ